jgi:hypothetical protein
MPPIRFWFACLAGFITGAASALSTVAVQLSGTPEPIASMTWLTIVAAGLVAAVGAGKLAWPVAPGLTARGYRRIVPEREGGK